MSDKNFSFGVVIGAAGLFVAFAVIFGVTSAGYRSGYEDGQASCTPSLQPQGDAKP